MEHNVKGYLRDVKHPTLPIIIRFENSVINYDQVFDESDLKEKASQLNNCYNLIHCNFSFVNN
jgi:hypothetical protein